MYLNPEEELKRLNNQVIRTQLMGAPAALLIGLGLYGIFAANGNAFLPMLNEAKVANSFIVVGIVLEVWQVMRLIPLVRKRTALQKTING